MANRKNTVDLGTKHTMDDEEKKRLRDNFKPWVLELVRKREAVRVRDVYAFIQSKCRKGKCRKWCDDSILCSCGEGYSEPEWHHMARRAMQDLQTDGEIKCEKRLWSRP